MWVHLPPSLSQSLLAVAPGAFLDHGLDHALDQAGVFTLRDFTESFYHKCMIPLLVVTAALAWAARPSTAEAIPAGFRDFRARYLVGWCLCVAADWLQGPYVYALYSAYGYSNHDNARLFVAGFGASLIFGCIVGSLVDRFGRKRSALAYCACYALSCMTKHVNIYWVLMLGRVLGGIATSLLFSCFECWMVSEHLGRHGFSAGLLSYMFGLMYQFMYVVAILSGVLAEFAADWQPLRPIYQGWATHVGGPTAPFDCAIVVMVLGAAHISAFWEENYGSSSSEVSEGSEVSSTASSSSSSRAVSAPNGGSIMEVIGEACQVLSQDQRILFLGVIVACFEAAMFAFVFNWTPALADKANPPPLGLIFSSFMMSCMCGASLGTIFASRTRPDTRVALLCGASVIAFFVVVVSVSGHYLRSCFCAFLVFECMVGVYFPTIGVLKSELVPEHVRGTVYNMYRVPLNGIVVCLLLTNLTLLECYGLCASLIMCAIVATFLVRRRATPPKQKGRV